jgi:hypothetical protein
MAAQDQHRGTRNDRTGGYVTMANAGVEIFLKRINLGATYQHPLWQNLSNNEIRANARATVHLTVMW